MKPKFKLVCWGPGLQIPVPLKYKWMAQDNGGEWRAFTSKPSIEMHNWWTNDRPSYPMLPLDLDIPPPEPGPWREQLYEIGEGVEW